MELATDAVAVFATGYGVYGFVFFGGDGICSDGLGVPVWPEHESGFGRDDGFSAEGDFALGWAHRLAALGLEGLGVQRHSRIAV